MSINSKTDSNNQADSPSKTQRRDFLKLSATSGAVLAAGVGFGVKTNEALADDFFATRGDRALGGQNRAATAARLKLAANLQHFDETFELPAQRDNNDERRYQSERFYASFSKCLPSNGFGEVNPSAFRQMRRAMRIGSDQAFNSIPLASQADRLLTNPQASFKFEVSALDSHATRINPSHQFRSPEIAAETGEVYWHAITRDVPFIEYSSSSLIDDAVTDLNGFSATAGATEGGVLSSNRLFRGETPGDAVGPFISQFLLGDIIFGPAESVQRYQEPITGQNFMVDRANWLNVQRGGAPNEPIAFDPIRRYVYNNRTLGEYVHRDISFQAYLNACVQLLNLGPDALDRGNPYVNGTTNQEGFVTFGAPLAFDLVTRAANIAFTGAWFQKWRVHRFLRPEAYGGRVHFNMTGQRDYELHPDILNSDALARVFSENGTYFLPQAFPEGSPTHPSYPAGHATVAGGCVTALKAFFDESFVLENTVEADASGTLLLPYSGDELTIGGELNKLANNIALGRNAAGVHYRQDGVQGLRAGEQQVIAYLQDQSRTFNEANFDGFSLTKFDGTPIVIRNGNVEST